MKKRNLFLNLAIIVALVFLFTGGVYATGEKKKETATKTTKTADKKTTKTANKTDTSVAKVNINKASKEELTQLDGIGPAKAEAIMAYREKNGHFAKPEDLMNVKGIGEATFNKNKNRIILK